MKKLYRTIEIKKKKKETFHLYIIYIIKTLVQTT